MILKRIRFKRYAIYLLEQTAAGIFSRRLGIAFANSVDEATEIAWRRAAQQAERFGVEPLDVVIWRQPKTECD